MSPLIEEAEKYVKSSDLGSAYEAKILLARVLQLWRDHENLAGGHCAFCEIERLKNLLRDKEVAP